MAKARPRRSAATSAAPPAPPATPAPHEAAPSRGPRPRWLLAAITLAFPWLLLAGLELGLRAGGYGSSYPLFVPYPDQPGYLLVNPDIGKRYFRGGPFTPSPQVDFFRAEKPPGTVRLFLQGESSAAGFPYGHGGAPSRMLQERLELAYPGRDVEVVNTALTAVNSYTLLDQADEIIDQQPDAVLIYTGHNEYYGAFGVGSTRALGGSPRVVRAYLALRKLRTVQLLENLLGARAAAPRPDDPKAPASVMELMAGDQRIAFGSRRYQQGLDQFRSNLSALLERYRAHGVKVFIGTLVSNERDQPPFVNGFAPGIDTLAWHRAYDAGVAALRAGDTAAARTALQRAIGIDSTAADAYFAYGRLMDAEWQRESAGQYYQLARDRDQLRFRAPAAMNAIIREEAARHGAVVVETELAVRGASPDSVVDHTLILEHLHPNLNGYFVIARAFYDALTRRGVMNSDPTAAVTDSAARHWLPATPVDSVAGLLRTNRLTASWPFQPRGAVVLQAVDTLHPRDEVERLAQSLVLERVTWPEAMDRQRLYFEKGGDADAAIRVARAMAGEYRYSAQPLLDASRIALEHRRYDEGLDYARLANARRETTKSAEIVGLLLMRQGNQPAALPYLERAAQMSPNDKQADVALTAARTLPRLEEARAKAPRDTTLLYDLAVAYALTLQYDKARSVLTTLRAVAPAHAGAATLLRKLPP
ncbi:MAG TPA: hypothetical protein VFJ74_08245 [Gemmatimonadaceae bacterium]|nr:hypothetical protein [Gemmatimonadaceae bacterium]